MSVLVTGGTGWVGRHLIPDLTDPVVVSRDIGRAASRTGDARLIECDLSAARIPAGQLTGIESVVNLLGESIADGRWTTARKKRIRDSRVMGTRHLVQSLMENDSLPHTFVSASAIGYYGDRGDTLCTESTPPSDDFLGEVCVQWESAVQPLVEAGVRVVWLRIGIVLGRGGGAAEKLLPPFRLGLGGRIGNGRQWMSWIHLQDLVELIPFCLNNPSLQGPINAVSPTPVRNSEFTQSLGQALNRPTLLGVPKFALRIALGEFANFLTASQRVHSQALDGSEFEFRYPTLELAWQEILSSQSGNH